MAPRKTVTLADHERVTNANGQVADAEAHAHLYARMEGGLARRLYEVWRQAGQLTGERWEWSNQSDRMQAAWLAVARANIGPAWREQFGVAEIAELTHA